MNKLLIVCGPTATGKTKLALKLAKKFDGELISADSRQVYKFMDIGTGKDIRNSEFRIPACICLRQKPMAGRQNSKLELKTQKWTVGFYNIEGIPLWLCDVVNPDQRFSVADYYELAWLVIKDIWKREKLPILVGGTGFYIKAVLDGIDTMGIPLNQKLRDELEKQTLVELQNQIKELNPQKWKLMNNSDRNNKRRLIRAIELSFNTKHVTCNKKNTIKSDLLMIGLATSRETLYQRIDERVEKRIKQGIIEEVKSLLNKGYGWDLYSMSGLGYRQWKSYFAKEEALNGVIEKWKLAEHDYAKRQITWFKKDQRVIWFDITKTDFPKGVFTLVSNWYNK